MKHPCKCCLTRSICAAECRDIKDHMSLIEGIFYVILFLSTTCTFIAIVRFSYLHMDEIGYFVVFITVCVISILIYLKLIYETIRDIMKKNEKIDFKQMVIIYIVAIPVLLSIYIIHYTYIENIINKYKYKYNKKIKRC